MADALRLLAAALMGMLALAAGLLTAFYVLAMVLYLVSDHRQALIITGIAALATAVFSATMESIHRNMAEDEPSEGVMELLARWVSRFVKERAPVAYSLGFVYLLVAIDLLTELERRANGQ